SDRRRQAAIDAKVKSFLSHPVTWQVHSDRRRVIGHMLPHQGFGRSGQCALDLGVKVKPGSVADRVGKLRPDDEVLEWNNRSLKRPSHSQEVFAILRRHAKKWKLNICNSSSSSICTNCRPDDLMAASQPCGSTRTASQDMAGAASPIPRFSSAGRIQLQLWFDPLVCQLTCCLMSAFGLAPSAPDGAPPSAFAVLGLVPEIDQKRKSKVVPVQLRPQWNSAVHLRARHGGKSWPGAACRSKSFDSDDRNGKQLIGRDPTQPGDDRLRPDRPDPVPNQRLRRRQQSHLVGGGVSRGGYGREQLVLAGPLGQSGRVRMRHGRRVIEDSGPAAAAVPYAYQQHPQYQQQQHRRRPGAGPDFEEGGGSDVSENSDAASELSKLSVVSTQSERPRMMRGGAAAAHAAAASATASRSSAMSAAAGATGAKNLRSRGRRRCLLGVR
uniref:PDZ_6 domain-containing protein n=1 Tax=Macrostomum lignano TaxID=282301 RepID=A0A1I8FBP2_9PLAT